MPKFLDITDRDYIEVAEKLDDDNELRIAGTMGSHETVFYFSEDGARDLAVGILNGLGKQSESPVLASSVSLNEGLLRLATVHGKTVRFDYRKEGSSFDETRRFKPLSCTGTGEHFRFVGPARDRADQTRAFRLDRIRGAVELVA